jgi:hypothetical protein
MFMNMFPVPMGVGLVVRVPILVFSLMLEVTHHQQPGRSRAHHRSAIEHESSAFLSRAKRLLERIACGEGRSGFVLRAMSSETVRVFIARWAAASGSEREKPAYPVRAL